MTNEQQPYAALLRAAIDRKLSARDRQRFGCRSCGTVVVGIADGAQPPVECPRCGASSWSPAAPLAAISPAA